MESDRSAFLNTYRGDTFDSLTLLSSVELVDIELATDDYIPSVDIREAFQTFKIEFVVEDQAFPQSCTVNLVNGAIYGPGSSASLVQQDRYFGHDDCIFADELAFMVIDMRDVGGNVVPIDDTAMFYDLYSIEFSEGT